MTSRRWLSATIVVDVAKCGGHCASILGLVRGIALVLERLDSRGPQLPLPWMLPEFGEHCPKGILGLVRNMCSALEQLDNFAQLSDGWVLEYVLKLVPEWQGDYRSPAANRHAGQGMRTHMKNIVLDTSAFPNSSLLTKSQPIISRSGSVEWHMPPTCLDGSVQG